MTSFSAAFSVWPRNIMSKNLFFTVSEENTLKLRGYSIEKKLGEGSYARVFLCRKDLGNKASFLACKVVDTKKAPPDFVKKFLPRELEILMSINHSHIIHVECMFQRRSKYYLFMRFAEKGDLLDFILMKGRLSENRARFWTFQIVSALQYLHNIDIVHRDIKCENVLITNALNIKICDFGFARRMPAGSLSSTYCGSLAYTAPEVLKGNPYNPRKSDIWACGIVLYVMLNRKLPFNETTNKKMVAKQMARAISNIPSVESSVSLQLKNTMFMLLEPNPAARWSSENFLSSPWIAMDQRLTKRMSMMEEQDRRASTLSSSEGTGKKLLDTAKSRALKDVSAVTVLKSADDISEVSLLGRSFGPSGSQMIKSRTSHILTPLMFMSSNSNPKHHTPGPGPRQLRR